jgi:hypothetical protein
MITGSGPSVKILPARHYFQRIVTRIGFRYNHSPRVWATGETRPAGEEFDMRLKIVPLYLFVLLAAVLVPGCAPVKGPGIQFVSEKYDFGTLPEGKIINFAFEFTNHGTETLIVGGVLSTCGCTYVSDADREVPPGKSGKISVSFNSVRLEGKVTRNIQVGTNVPGKENISLTIEGTVIPNPAASSNKVGGE